MEVTIKVSDELAAQARAHGVPLEAYVQDIVARQAAEASAMGRVEAVDAAINRIIELRKGNDLTGLRTKDFIHEGHKY
jgi:hypothetical protein